MNVNFVERALIDALRTSRAPPLNAVDVPQYYRELRTQEKTEGTVICQLDKKGFRRYKSRRASNQEPPSVDIEGIQQALNEALEPYYRVMVIEEERTFLRIIMEVLLCSKN